MAVKQSKIQAQAPGRINIIGDHTDYNEGFVLPAAIDKKTIVRLHVNGSAHEVGLRACDRNETHTFSLREFQALPQGWQNYLMGVVYELQKLGAKLSGFDCEFEGNVPIGSGMSSSASLECSLAYGLNHLFELGLDKMQLIQVCKKAENNFVGMPCGVMDQFASMMGKENQVMLLDCRSLDFSFYPCDLGNYQILLLNSQVSHELASSEYHTRKQECQEAVTILQEKNKQVQSLRDVSHTLLSEHQSKMTETLYKRCRHVLSENQRVLDAVEALQKKDYALLGQLMYGSHQSLQKDYAVSCPEIDYLVDFTQDKDYILGSRMMGGGFGGCTINLIEKQKVPEFISLISRSYRDAFGKNLSPYHVTIEDGASLIP